MTAQNKATIQKQTFKSSSKSELNKLRKLRVGKDQQIGQNEITQVYNFLKETIGTLFKNNTNVSISKERNQLSWTFPSIKRKYASDCIIYTNTHLIHITS